MSGRMRSSCCQKQNPRAVEEFLGRGLNPRLPAAQIRLMLGVDARGAACATVLNIREAAKLGVAKRALTYHRLPRARNARTLVVAPTNALRMIGAGLSAVRIVHRPKTRAGRATTESE